MLSLASSIYVAITLTAFSLVHWENERSEIHTSVITLYTLPAAARGYALVNVIPLCAFVCDIRTAGIFALQARSFHTCTRFNLFCFKTNHLLFATDFELI